MTVLVTHKLNNMMVKMRYISWTKTRQRIRKTIKTLKVNKMNQPYASNPNQSSMRSYLPVAAQ